MKSRNLVVGITAFFLVAAAFYTFNSIDVVLRYAPHALYADQWRQYLHYVTLPFPQNIFHPDNGHRLVLPNLIAWLEIEWFSGNQWLQIGTGLACGLMAATIAALLSASDRVVPAAYRAAAAFLCFFAIFWLANVRTLFHSTELLHTKLPMLCLIAAIALSIVAARRAHASFALFAALLLALGATFSFGYGLSVFLGVFATLIARKARPQLVAICIAGLVVTAGLYLALPGSDGVRGVMTFAPLENLLAGARWLGAPFVTMVSYLWDPGATGLVPTDTLRSLTGAVAASAAAHLSDLHVSVLPQALFGAFGMLALVVASWRRLRASDAAGPMEATGLGIAWFGLGAAGIVSLSRLAYFHEHPEQIYADRYLCWPCLFWLGIALIGLSRRTEAKAGSVAANGPSIASKAVFACALAIPVFAWPTQFGGSIYAALVRGHIDNMAVGSIVGVFPRGADTGESDAEEIARGVPELSSRHIAQFADDVASMPGKTLPATARLLDDATVETTPVTDNLLGEPGTSVAVRFPKTAPDTYRLLLVDAGNRVVGVAVRDARMQPAGYSGYVRGALAASDLRVAAAP
jgi:hypothetical protein